MNKLLVRVGVMYYNIDKDHFATVTDITDTEIHYQWKRVDGKSLQDFISGANGKCRVPLATFRQYLIENRLQELSPLEMELV